MIKRDELRQFFSFLEQQSIPYQTDVLLKTYTTFRLGGISPCLCFCETPKQVLIVLRKLAHDRLPFLLIGHGSNLLVSDHGVPDKIIVRYASDAPCVHKQGELLNVSGGTSLDSFVSATVEQGIDEFVYCSGIPGTVGGAITGNAGAFGWQIADRLHSIRLIDRNGITSVVSPQDIGFSYRHSHLRERGLSVLEASFYTTKASTAELRDERIRILTLRACKHPDCSIVSCAGSFFKNIQPTCQAKRRQAAGWFLEVIGGKNMCVGGAGVFAKHANILVKNTNECTAQDVLSLSRTMAKAVKNKFGITLKREVQLIGGFVTA